MRAFSYRALLAPDHFYNEEVELLDRAPTTRDFQDAIILLLLCAILSRVFR